jgi:hypothetical protein
LGRLLELLEGLPALLCNRDLIPTTGPKRNNSVADPVNSDMHGAQATIQKAVLSWEGVTSQSHRFGGVEFRFGKVELGHLHGDHLADLPFPKKLRDELVEAGRAQPHHVLPSSGWVSRPIQDSRDVDEVIALFRLNYERLTARRKAVTA